MKSNELWGCSSEPSQIEDYTPSDAVEDSTWSFIFSLICVNEWHGCVRGALQSLNCDSGCEERIPHLLLCGEGELILYNKQILLCVLNWLLSRFNWPSTFCAISCLMWEVKALHEGLTASHPANVYKWFSRSFPYVAQNECPNAAARSCDCCDLWIQPITDRHMDTVIGAPEHVMTVSQSQPSHNVNWDVSLYR